MSSVLAIIVAYHPESRLSENAKALLAEVSHLVVVDNESSDQSRLIINSIGDERVSIVINDTNNGVARGFNQGIQWGLQRGYDYFLLMDQDSHPMPGMVQNLIFAFEALKAKNPLSIVGPEHRDYSQKESICPSKAEFTPIQLLITSGSLLSREVIETVGMYDERLFIDHVDHDYCLRVIRRGGVCMKVNSAVLLHSFGAAKLKKVFGRSFFLQEYSPFRRYFIMRNRIVLYKRYGLFSGEWFWIDLKVAVKDLVKLVLFESSKFRKLQALVKGLIHGICWKD